MLLAVKEDKYVVKITKVYAKLFFVIWSLVTNK